MKSSTAHMIIKALTLGGLSEPYLPPLSSHVCHSHSQSSTRILIHCVLLWKTTTHSIKRAKTFRGIQFVILKHNSPACVPVKSSLATPLKLFPMCMTATAVPACTSFQKHTNQEPLHKVRSDPWHHDWWWQLLKAPQFASSAPIRSVWLQVSLDMLGTQVPSGPKWDLRSVGCSSDLY